MMLYYCHLLVRVGINTYFEERGERNLLKDSIPLPSILLKGIILMDDKTKNDKEQENQMKIKMIEFIQGNTSKRRQRKRSKATHFSNRNKDDTSQQADLMKKRLLAIMKN